MATTLAWHMLGEITEPPPRVAGLLSVMMPLRDLAPRMSACRQSGGAKEYDAKLCAADWAQRQAELQSDGAAPLPLPGGTEK